MSKLVMLYGLAASGKSTYARELARQGYIRTNKDDIRDMLNDGKWSKNNEKFVLKVRDLIIKEALLEGKSVVVDDTNLAPKHRERLSQLAKEFGATFETKFFDVDVEECIKRDLKRENSVGSKVIRSMYNQFLRERVVYEPPLDKPEAIIVDLDGTLAHMEGRRGPFDWDKVRGDSLDVKIANLLTTIKTSPYAPDAVIILSGRNSVCRDETIEWLARHGIEYDFLYMRAEGDDRKDAIIKKELFDEYIRDEYAIRFVLDDRPQVIRMWQNEIGVKVLGCNDDYDVDF